MTIGKKLNEIRISLNKTLREFDVLTGISYGYLGLLERGNSGHADGKKTTPTIDVLKQICDRSGYDFRTFLEETEYLTPITQIKKTQPNLVEPNINATILNDEEQYIIDIYRNCPKESKLLIKNLFNGLETKKVAPYNLA